ncbi:cyclin-dependent kinase C-1-like [Olea europaea var. sylvestris]|uniref:cyclin-dependent kinase C-1-like n=1 Tax=Olea europaea var. sylvestris TaxID=158386 RepID=UPI000C1D5D1C|nr:cyclin-dependent kinase C-1-like [Olea europaea var. sylvestris]
MAREKGTGEIVALKKIRMDNEKEGFPITAIREIKILKKLQHENVIKLKEIVTSPGPEVEDQGKPDGNKYKGNIYMVFEYMDHDLTGLADRPGLRFTIPQIKCYMKQLLTGLHYCHVNQVLHRDIKGSNLLIDNEGNLKLADFGLARSYSSDHNANLTNRVITLWYRPPELLLGATKYGPAVDMWSVGCIFAELLNGKPILPGKNEVRTLLHIFSPCLSHIIGMGNMRKIRYFVVLIVALPSSTKIVTYGPVDCKGGKSKSIPFFKISRSCKNIGNASVVLDNKNVKINANNPTFSSVPAKSSLRL